MSVAPSLETAPPIDQGLIDTFFADIRRDAPGCVRRALKAHPRLLTTRNPVNSYVAETPLQMAAGGALKVCRVLVALGADPNEPNRLDTLPVEQAVIAGHTDIVAFLLGAAAPEHRAVHAARALEQSLVGGQDHLAKILLEGGARIRTAVDKNQHEHAPPLTIAARAVRSDRALACCRLLLQWGADPNERGLLGTTALMAAAAVGHEDVCRVLLEAGADPDARNNFGQSVDEQAVPSVRALLRAERAARDKAVLTKALEESDPPPASASDRPRHM